MNWRPELDIIQYKAYEYMDEHFTNESFPNDPEDVILVMSDFAEKHHSNIIESYKQSTVDSLKSSLMDRFKQMHHASEERYAEEAAKFFAWIVDSWKREEILNDEIIADLKAEIYILRNKVSILENNKHLNLK